jgi:hypothetical protein
VETHRPERNSADWAKTISELRALSDDELIPQHDELIVGKFRAVAVGVDYYRDELARRTTERHGTRMFWLTVAATGLTAFNTALVIIALVAD